MRFFFVWEKGGVPHACHQRHILTVEDDHIGADTMFCGGRWPAALFAEMAEASETAETTETESEAHAG